MKPYNNLYYSLSVLLEIYVYIRSCVNKLFNAKKYHMSPTKTTVIYSSGIQPCHSWNIINGSMNDTLFNSQAISRRHIDRIS